MKNIITSMTNSNDILQIYQVFNLIMSQEIETKMYMEIPFEIDFADCIPCLLKKKMNSWMRWKITIKMGLISIEKIYGIILKKYVENQHWFSSVICRKSKIGIRIKYLCICGIRNDSNRPGIHSGKTDIQKHHNNISQRRHLNGIRCAEDNHRCDRQ